LLAGLDVVVRKQPRWERRSAQEKMQKSAWIEHLKVDTDSLIR